MYVSKGKRGDAQHGAPIGGLRRTRKAWEGIRNALTSAGEQSWSWTTHCLSQAVTCAGLAEESRGIGSNRKQSEAT